MSPKKITPSRRRSSKGPGRGSAANPGPRSKRPQPKHCIELSILAHDGLRADNVRVLCGSPPPKARAGSTVPPSDLAAWARSISRGTQPVRLARMLAALAHPQRLQILLHLLTGEASYQSLAHRTGLKAGPLYHHIRELRSAGFLSPKRRDLYALTRLGRRVTLAATAVGHL